MIKLLLLFILPFTLYASKILSYNIYDRSDRVDVMITFDTPYSGVIKQSIGESTITIKLQDSSIESAKIKQLSSRFIKSLSITPMSGYTKIVALVPPSIMLKASKTSDAYGLRLRFITKPAQAKNTTLTSKKASSPFGALPTKKEDDTSQSYYIVIAILIIGILILFYVKKRVTPTTNKQTKSSSWLFKENLSTTGQTSKQIDEINSDVSIRFQKTVDHDNSVVMLDFANQSYLILVGKNNVLLDKYTDNKPQSQEDFNTILQSRHKELDDFLHNDGIKEKEDKEPLQAYKERAAAIIYDS